MISTQKNPFTDMNLLLIIAGYLWELRLDLDTYTFLEKTKMGSGVL
jgi:hypothetical protein